MKKKAFYIISIMIIISLSGCKKKNSNKDNQNNQNNSDTSLLSPTAAIPPASVTPPADVTVTPTVTPGHENDMKSDLTGLWVPIKVGNKRPFAIQFNNYKYVKNQWGLSQADIVYEALVEGGITRILGIGENYTEGRIGSLRSSRHYFASIADAYDAIYIHYGKTKYAKAKIKELGINNLDGETGLEQVFYRVNSLSAPHNAFTSLKGILAGIKIKGYDTQHSKDYQKIFSFYETDTELTGGSSANKISINFSSYNSPYLKYNDTDKLYYEFQYGVEHIDSNTGKQLTFKNVIIQFVKEWNIDHNGYQTMDFENASGKGYYISNGKAVPITWKKNEAKSFMKYYDEAGNELTMNPGKTYVALFPNNRTEDVVIK